MKTALSSNGARFNTQRVQSGSGESNADVSASMVGIVTTFFGLIWLINAAIQARAWLFAPHGAGPANLVRAFASAQNHAPAWLRPLLGAAVHGIGATSPTFVAALMVAIAAVLGIALVSRRRLGAIAVFGVAYSLICWVLLDALGFPYANGQTDPGVFIPYAIAFLFLLSVYRRSGSGRAAAAGSRLWEAARIAFGLLWAFDATLKWLPAFMFHFTSQITGIISGQPQWVAAWLRGVADLVTIVGPVLVAVIVALVETAIALGLLAKRLMIIVLPVGVAYSLSVWATAEAFGGPYSSAGTGVRGNVIGNVIIYLIPFFFLGAELLSRRTRLSRNESASLA